jgi:tetratricopeptide (TPR) repeat protein
LLERRVLTGGADGIRWEREAVVEIPPTVQDIVRARLDRLPAPVKRTLQGAAVIGRDFGRRLLARVVEDNTEVDRHLQTLTHAELVHETRALPEQEYTFKHAVIRDVAYHSLIAPQRQQLHGLLASALEELHADRLEEHAAILAHHCGRGEFLDKAVAYALLAGDRAARLFASADAAAHYQQALDWVRRLPPSLEAQRSQIDAALKLAGVGLTRQQDVERDRQNLDAARILAEALKDDTRLARVLYWLGRIHYVLWNPEAATEYARRSLDIADRLGDGDLAAPPVDLIGRLYWQQSKYAQASRMMERTVQLVRGLGNPDKESTAAAFTGFVFGFTGEFDRALGYVEQGVRLAQESQNPYAQAAAYYFRGAVLTQRGEWKPAIADYEDATRIAAMTGDVFRVYLVKFSEGWAYVNHGDLGRARVLLEESGALAVRLGTKFGLAWQKIYLANCLLALGEVDPARASCVEAIGLAEETGDDFIRALCHRCLGEIATRLEPSDPATAERAILEAIRIQQEIGARPELARSHFSIARLLRRWGKTERGREHLAQAVRLFRGMGMAWDLARADVH